MPRTLGAHVLLRHLIPLMNLLSCSSRVCLNVFPAWTTVNHYNNQLLLKERYYNGFIRDLSLQDPLICVKHCVKSVRTWSYSDPYFPAFGPNKERYRVSPRIQFECGKIPTRITPNTDTFYAVKDTLKTFLGNVIRCSAQRL